MSVIRNPDSTGVSVVDYKGAVIGTIKQSVQKLYQCEICNQREADFAEHMLRIHGEPGAKVSKDLKVVFGPTKPKSRVSYLSEDKKLEGISDLASEAVYELLVYYRKN